MRTNISIFTLCLIAALIGCSKPAPQLGKSITTVESTDGVAVSEIEARRLQPDGKLAGEQGALVEVESTVSKINYEKRMVALTTAKGEIVELVVGPEVKNFNQIRLGDKVNASYLVSIAFEVREPTEDEKLIAGQAFDASARAKLGQLPAASTATGKVKIGKITAIDKGAETVTIEGLRPQGATVFKAKYPENLGYVKVGDSIVVTMIQAFATAVTRIP